MEKERRDGERTESREDRERGEREQGQGENRGGERRKPFNAPESRPLGPAPSELSSFIKPLGSLGVQFGGHRTRILPQIKWVPLSSC